VDSVGATRTPGSGARWFVRAAAVIVGLINLRAFVWWFGYPSEGDGSWLLGDGVSFLDALPSVLAVLVAALATSELVLRRSGRDIVSEDYALRCAAAFGALCIGGALAGGLLAALWAVDGTMFADPPAGYFSSPANLLGAMVGSLPVGVLGAAVGGLFGLLEGAVLAFPLAAILGRFGDGESSGGAGTVRPSGVV
jgi:hypothetical protein